MAPRPTAVRAPSPFSPSGSAIRRTAPGATSRSKAGSAAVAPARRTGLGKHAVGLGPDSLGAGRGEAVVEHDRVARAEFGLGCRAPARPVAEGVDVHLRHAGTEHVRL